MLGVDARRRLRRYLEQRREMGERELVLDQFTVDDVLRILGAAPVAGSAGQPADLPVALPVAVPVAAPVAVPAAVPVALPVAVPTAVPDAKPFSAPPVRADTKKSATAAVGPWPPGLGVGKTDSELFAGPLAELTTLAGVARATATCTRCPLSSTAIQTVPGEGPETARLVCVGEAPGAREDETGRPFVGPAGKLLEKILAAIGLARDQVFICNVLKHRPPGNRNPRPEEVSACSPFLVRQLEIIRPRVIVAFGTFAAQTLLETTLAIGKLRGQVHRYYGVPLIVTYHPAALLRNPNWKRPTWDDVQYARRILDGATPVRV